MHAEQEQGRNLHFLKMQALGNDFVIIDLRRTVSAAPVDAEFVRAAADRRLGIGFDQLAILRGDPDASVDAAVEFRNADGSPSAACGNASRCIGRILMNETGRDLVRIRTGRGILPVRMAGDGNVSVNMGSPQTAWKKIPLARDVDTLALPLEGSPVAVGMGNPHCVFFVDDIEAISPERRGPAVERDPLFPERTNVEFVQVLDRGNLRMRVWERGAGVTPASGSGSCATAVAAHLRGLADRSAAVHLDGGVLAIDWTDDGVWMTGPAFRVFSGSLAPGFPEAA